MYRIDEHGQRVPIFGQPGADRCCATVVSLVPGARGSRRRRLWELDGQAHCPVVGVCLPAAAALRLAGKLFGDEAPTDDYARHRRLVGECKSRTATAEQVHKALDELHAGAIRRAGASKSAEALADWWRAHSSDAGLAGTLWAVLTHPRCTPTLEERILGEVHMRQHQVGFENRADLARLRALEQANAALITERSELQARIARQTAEHAAERQNWQAEAVRLRGHLLSRETLIVLLRDEAEAARRAAPDLPSRKALALQLQAQGERLATLQRELAQAHEVAARQRATALRRESSAEVPEAA